MKATLLADTSSEVSHNKEWWHIEEKYPLTFAFFPCERDFDILSPYVMLLFVHTSEHEGNIVNRWILKSNLMYLFYIAVANTEHWSAFTLSESKFFF